MKKYDKEYKKEYLDYWWGFITWRKPIKTQYK